MIKIIEQGQKTFIRTCDRCGCKFQYDLSDLSGLEYISCPCCHNTLIHMGPKAVNIIEDINKPGPDCATGRVDPNITIYANKLSDDIVDDPYNNLRMSLPDDIKDNCCYESDSYKAWHEKWCKEIRDNAAIECKNKK